LRQRASEDAASSERPPVSSAVVST
jgi:hypothetical protein